MTTTRLRLGTIRLPGFAEDSDGDTDFGLSSGDSTSSNDDLSAQTPDSEWGIAPEELERLKSLYKGSQSKKRRGTKDKDLLVCICRDGRGPRGIEIAGISSFCIQFLCRVYSFLSLSLVSFVIDWDDVLGGPKRSLGGWDVGSMVTPCWL